MSHDVSTTEKRLVVNGETRQLAARSVDDLVAHLGLGQRRRGIAVAINGEVVRRADWPHRTLRDGDEIEIVGAVQGG